MDQIIARFGRCPGGADGLVHVPFILAGYSCGKKSIEQGKRMSKSSSRAHLPIAFMTLGLLVVLVAAACAGVPAGPAPVPPSATSRQPTATPTEIPAAHVSVTPALAVSSTEPPAADPSATPAVSFSRDVLPIIQANCTRCHGDGRHVAGLNLNGYDKIMAYASYGLVVPGDPANSILVEIISYGMMPPGGAAFSPQSLQILRDWIQAGAPNN
jgi:hypothetical protein